MKKKITVITGGRGAGKTTWCLSQWEALRKSGARCAGIIAPGRYQDGKKTGFSMMDASTGETRLAGSADPAQNLGTPFHHWSLSQDAFHWANAIFDSLAPCDVLFVDELGPLEFTHKQGIFAALDALRNPSFSQCYVVIRPECLEDFELIGFSFETLWIGESR